MSAMYELLLIQTLLQPFTRANKLANMDWHGGVGEATGMTRLRFIEVSESRWVLLGDQF